MEQAGQYLNALLNTDDRESLKALFDMKNERAMEFMKYIEPRHVDSRYSGLVTSYRDLLSGPSLSRATLVIKEAFHAGVANSAIQQLIKNAILLIQKEESVREAGSPETSSSFGQSANEFKKTLFSVFKEVCDRTPDLSTYICNVLVGMHLTDHNYTFIEDLIKMNSVGRHNTNFYVFQFYSGISNVHKENFYDGWSALSTAFRCKALRPHIFTTVFAISLLGLTHSTQENWFLISEDSHSGDGSSIYQYSDESLNVPRFLREYFDGDEYSEQLLEQGTNIRKLLQLREILRNGFVTLIDNREYTHLFRNMNITRTMQIYIPLVCIRNLIYRFYLANSKPSKLPLSDIIDFLGLETSQTYSMVLNCIQRRLIRGYLSVNKSILVLSKEKPFPDLLTEK